MNDARLSKLEIPEQVRIIGRVAFTNSSNNHSNPCHIHQHISPPVQSHPHTLNHHHHHQHSCYKTTSRYILLYGDYCVGSHGGHNALSHLPSPRSNYSLPHFPLFQYMYGVVFLTAIYRNCNHYVISKCVDHLLLHMTFPTHERD